MLRVVTIAAIVLLLAGSALAGPKMMLGPKAGVTMSNLTGDVAELFVDTKMKIGFGAGAFVNIGLGEGSPVSIQPEVMYVMKGCKFDYESDPQWKVDVIEIPVLIKYTVPTEGGFQPNFFAGPAIGFIMTSELEEDGDTEDFKDYTKSIDFGVALGAGFNYMMQSGGALTFDVRFTLGLSNILDLPEEAPDFSVKTSTIMATLGYGFPI